MDWLPSLALSKSKAQELQRASAFSKGFLGRFLEGVFSKQLGSLGGPICSLNSCWGYPLGLFSQGELGSFKLGDLQSSKLI